MGADIEGGGPKQAQETNIIHRHTTLRLLWPSGPTAPPINGFLGGDQIG